MLAKLCMFFACLFLHVELCCFLASSARFYNDEVLRVVAFMFLHVFFDEEVGGVVHEKETGVAVEVLDVGIFVTKIIRGSVHHFFE